MFNNLSHKNIFVGSIASKNKSFTNVKDRTSFHNVSNLQGWAVACVLMSFHSHHGTEGYSNLGFLDFAETSSGNPVGCLRNSYKRVI